MVERSATEARQRRQQEKMVVVEGGCELDKGSMTIKMPKEKKDSGICGGNGELSETPAGPATTDIPNAGGTAHRGLFFRFRMAAAPAVATSTSTQRPSLFVSTRASEPPTKAHQRSNVHSTSVFIRPVPTRRFPRNSRSRLPGRWLSLLEPCLSPFGLQVSSLLHLLYSSQMTVGSRLLL
jgi:hypothetical protein